jgi:hypothetical protein
MEVRVHLTSSLWDFFLTCFSRCLHFETFLLEFSYILKYYKTTSVMYLHFEKISDVSDIPLFCPRGYLKGLGLVWCSVQSHHHFLWKEVWEKDIVFVGVYQIILVWNFMYTCFQELVSFGISFLVSVCCIYCLSAIFVIRV